MRYQLDSYINGHVPRLTGSNDQSETLDVRFMHPAPLGLEFLSSCTFFGLLASVAIV